MSALTPHPQSKSIARRLESIKRDFFVSRAGVVYRATQAKWTKAKDVVSGVGALKVPGRWHPKQSEPTCYTTLTPETALAESLATVRYFGLPIDNAFPKTIVTIRYRLTKIIDLCHGTTRQRLRLGIESMRKTDWRRDNRHGQEALTQAWGRCAIQAGVEAILVPSNALSDGSNLVVFQTMFCRVLYGKSKRKSIGLNNETCNFACFYLSQSPNPPISGKRVMSATSISLPYSISKASQSGPALWENRRFLGIPREVFAPLAHFSVRKLATYEKEEVLPQSVARPVNETLRILVALREIVDDQSKLRDWLETTNPAFDNRVPKQVIQDGESDLVWEMIHQVRSGTFA